MSTSATNKQELIDWIDRLEDQAMLQNLVNLKETTEGKDFWHDLPEEVKEAINRGKKQLDEGKGIPHEQVRKKIKDRFLR